MLIAFGVGTGTAAPGGVTLVGCSPTTGAAFGFGLLVAALTVSYRDVQYILPVFVNILLYASPVAYGLGYAVGKLSAVWRPYYTLNPLAGLLEAFRWSLLDTSAPTAGVLLYDTVVAAAVFAVGAYSFKRMERRFADVI